MYLGPNLLIPVYSYMCRVHVLVPAPPTRVLLQYEKMAYNFCNSIPGVCQGLLKSCKKQIVFCPLSALTTCLWQRCRVGILCNLRRVSK